MEIKRIDPLGIISGIIKELGLIQSIDERLKKDQNDQENISPGEAIAGMIINGLGFSDKPLSLTPKFFETKALEILFRSDVKAEHFNRHKLGKVLDMTHDYGCEQLFYELSLKSCIQEKINTQFNSEDTTTFSLTGQYSEDTDEATIKITQGYSKDHRQDLKQVVQELMVSQDGGVPLMMKSWDGNASDNEIFRERSQALINHFKESIEPRYLIADSKLYTEKNATNLDQIPFITRVPGTIKDEGCAINEAISKEQWQVLDPANKFYIKNIIHYNIVQRWLVVYSEKARERSKKTLEKSCKKEHILIEKEIWHLSNQAYDCEGDAEKALKKLLKKCRFHTLDTQEINQKKVYEYKGRPKAETVPSTVRYFILGTIKQDKETLDKMLNEKSCYVLATNIATDELNEVEIIQAYKRQNSSIENMGFRFLKDPIFFTSSLFLKKPSRIMGLLMVMTLALLVYSIAQRRLRNKLEENKETLPNQINQPTRTPTLRWIFQLMEGVHIVKIKVDGVSKIIINGIDSIKKKIIMLLGEAVISIYQIQINEFT